MIIATGPQCPVTDEMAYKFISTVYQPGYADIAEMLYDVHRKRDKKPWQAWDDMLEEFTVRMTLSIFGKPLGEPPEYYWDEEAKEIKIRFEGEES